MTNKPHALKSIKQAEENMDFLNAGYLRRLRAERAAARTYVPCTGCGLRNYDTDDPLWTCPDFPKCRAILDRPIDG